MPGGLENLLHLGRAWGWKPDSVMALERLTDAAVARKPIAVYQDAGRTNWAEGLGGWPEHFYRIDAWPVAGMWDGVLVISDRQWPVPSEHLRATTAILRPPSLTLGVACRRYVTTEELVECVQALFLRHQLHLNSLAAVATVQIRRNETALVDFTDERALPLLTYPAERLHAMLKHHGRPGTHLAGTCQKAALVAAGTTEILVPTTPFARLTLAVARRGTA
jgi:cobalt-precorrin 5A hydrolase